MLIRHRMPEAAGRCRGSAGKADIRAAMAVRLERKIGFRVAAKVGECAGGDRNAAAILQRC